MRLSPVRRAWRLPATLMLLAASTVSGADKDGATTRPLIAGGISYDDYPTHSRRLDEEGDATVAFTVDRAGKVTNCSITESSGFPLLDAASCKAVKRFRFAEQLGSDQPSEDRITQKIRWTLGPSRNGELNPLTGASFPEPFPEASRGINLTQPGELPAGRRSNIALYLKVGTDGSVKSCRVEWGSGNGDLDKKTCEIVAAKWRYKPAMKKGSPVEVLHLETFFWAAPDAHLPSEI